MILKDNLIIIKVVNIPILLNKYNKLIIYINRVIYYLLIDIYIYIIL